MSEQVENGICSEVGGQLLFRSNSIMAQVLSSPRRYRESLGPSKTARYYTHLDNWTQHEALALGLAP